MRMIILALLVAGIIAFSGCPAVVDDSPEGQALALTNTTVEGKLANTLMPLLLKTGNCTTGEYQTVAEDVQALVSDAGYDVDLPTEAGESGTLVAGSKSCNVQINREATEIDPTHYQFNYEVVVDPGCPYPELDEAAADYDLQIDVDLEAETATVSQGKLTAEAAAEASALHPAFGLTGNCSSPVLLAIGLMDDLVGAAEPEEPPIEEFCEYSFTKITSQEMGMCTDDGYGCRGDPNYPASDSCPEGTNMNNTYAYAAGSTPSYTCFVSQQIGTQEAPEGCPIDPQIVQCAEGFIVDPQADLSWKGAGSSWGCWYKCYAEPDPYLANPNWPCTAEGYEPVGGGGGDTCCDYKG